MADDLQPPEPISYVQAKAQLRIDTDDEQLLIEALIVAAREHVEDFTGLVLTPRMIAETARTLGRWIDLASWPVRSVGPLSYTDYLGQAQPIDATALIVSIQRRPVRIRPIVPGWSAACPCSSMVPGPVSIAVEAGYATPGDVPATLTQAMLLLIQHWYDNRSAVEAGARAAALEMPLGVGALLRRWRMRSI